MKAGRIFCIAITLWIGATHPGNADGHGGWAGGWHGGGGWRGGGYYGRGYYGGRGVVIVTPGYYYPPYPYYYNAPYYYGSYAGPAYYSRGADAASIPTEVQEQLSRRGYYKGPIDGIVGAGTRAAISAYQRSHGLEMSGNIDTPLIRSLRL